ncbi:hypothetical protein LTR17_025976 [Elasticomyces elasticus]|nr:hypothetical protein LTR17_025976 [Elasticomyces elasticus]
MPFLAETHVPISNKDILSWIFEHEEEDADRPIYVDGIKPERSISRKQALIIIRKLAAGFYAAGIYYSILVFGIVATGAIFTGTDLAYTKIELAHHFKTAGVRFIITQADTLSTVLEASKDLPLAKSSVWIFGSSNPRLTPYGFPLWSALFKHGERDWYRFENEEQCRTTTAAYLFSSGTTGLSKAAVVSHQNLIAQYTLVSEAHRAPYKIFSLVYLPTFHAAAFPTAHIRPLRSCVTSCVIPRLEIDVFLKTIDTYQITDVILVPPVVVAILKHSGIKKSSLQSLRFVLVGAAPLGKNNQAALQKMLSSQATVTQVWGMTEATCIATTFRYPEKDETGSVGRMLPNLVSKIINEDGEEITAYDKMGEVCIRGPTIISRYLNNPTATAESFDHEGYYKTGDIMYCSSRDRKWYVVDRRKELIKVRGFRVAPAEIEDILLTHPSVADAAVIGAPSTIAPGDELPRAYIVRNQKGANLTEKNVVDYCKERLAKYKNLTGGVVFLKSLPRNATGKLLKRDLRAMVKLEASSHSAKL